MLSALKQNSNCSLRYQKILLNIQGFVVEGGSCCLRGLYQGSECCAWVVCLWYTTFGVVVEWVGESVVWGGVGSCVTVWAV